MTRSQHSDALESVNHELMRTLSRLPPTPLVQRYGRALAAIQQEAGVLHPAHYATQLSTPAHAELAAIGESRCAELRTWVATAPWHAFSLVVGLAQGDENLAWGLAYG